QEIGEADMRRRLVHDDAHRALGRVDAHVDHAARKAIVAHGWHRDQHLPVEIAALRAAPLLPRARRHPRFCRFGTGHVGILVGRRSPGLVPRAGLASELHVEMLPDWMAIANNAPSRNYASFVPQSSCHNSATMRRKP